MIDAVGFKARPAWTACAAWMICGPVTVLHGVRRLNLLQQLRRRACTAAVAQLGGIALIALACVPDAVCVDIETRNESSTSDGGTHNESSTSRHVCLDGVSLCDLT